MRLALLTTLAMTGFASRAGTAPPAAPSAPPVLRLRAAQLFDEGHAWHRCFERLGELAREKTSGSVELQIYSGGILGQEKDYIQHLVEGRLDLAVLAPGWAGNLARQVELLDMLFLWRDREHWAAALDGDVGRRIHDMVERETAKGSHPGLKVLGYLGGSERYLMSRTRGYTTLPELAGLRLRVLDSPVQLESWKTLGASPVALPFGATYAAVKARTVDALENEMGNAFQMKLHEVAPHVTETAHIITVRPLLMSGHTWRKLTPAQQAAVMEAAREAVAMARGLERRQNEEAISEMKKLGVKFHAVPERTREQMRELTRPLGDAFARERGMVDLLQAVQRAK